MPGRRLTGIRPAGPPLRTVRVQAGCRPFVGGRCDLVSMTQDNNTRRGTHAVEVASQTDVIDAGDLGDVVDVVDEHGERRRRQLRGELTPSKSADW